MRVRLAVAVAEVREAKTVILAETLKQNRGPGSETLILAEPLDEIEVPSVKMLILAETVDRNRGSESENVDFS